MNRNLNNSRIELNIKRNMRIFIISNQKMMLKFASRNNDESSTGGDIK